MTEATPSTSLEARINEVSQYQANIEMYKTIAMSLPTEWPDRLIQHKDAADKHTTIGGIEDLEDVVLLSDLWAGDDCRKAIRTETLEMRKAQAILTALQNNS